MPCGSAALVAAYVVYQSLSFTERALLVEALRELGYGPTCADNVDDTNSSPVDDDSGRVVAGAAIVISSGLPSGFGELGFVLLDGAYVPIVPTDARAEGVLRSIRAAYGRAHAGRIASQAKRRFNGTVRLSGTTDGAVTIRVRF
jgi:hypothetical protein